MLLSAPHRRWLSTPVDLLHDLDNACCKQAVRPTNQPATATYPVDVREEDGRFIVEAEVPGYTKDQIGVSLENGVLAITAERAVAEMPKGHQRHLHERRFTRVSRKFTLPRSVDPNAIEATLEHGVLTLTIAKREEVKARKIEVK
ncbi:MAG: Hsp20/alpha crystallin family protein [Planctomycetota bacterium]